MQKGLLFTKTYINRFSGVFSTKLQRTNMWKIEYTQLRRNVFRKVDLRDYVDEFELNCI